MLSIEQINELEAELESKKQMLIDAHFQNKKLADELLLTQNQYIKVVEQNKNFQTTNFNLIATLSTVKVLLDTVMTKNFTVADEYEPFKLIDDARKIINKYIGG